MFSAAFSPRDEPCFQINIWPGIKEDRVRSLLCSFMYSSDMLVRWQQAVGQLATPTAVDHTHSRPPLKDGWDALMLLFLLQTKMHGLTFEARAALSPAAPPATLTWSSTSSRVIPSEKVLCQSHRPQGHCDICWVEQCHSCLPDLSQRLLQKRWRSGTLAPRCISGQGRSICPLD